MTGAGTPSGARAVTSSEPDLRRALTGLHELLGLSTLMLTNVT